MATHQGKDGYKIDINKSGPGYGWEVTDPQGKKCCRGLQANSEQHAKEQADQKLGMRIFNSVNVKPGDRVWFRKTGDRSATETPGQVIKVGSLITVADEQGNKHEIPKSDIYKLQNSAFLNGRAKAEQAIGARLENSDDPITKGYSVTEGPRAYQAGREAYEAGKPQSTNPYEGPNKQKWLEGWRDAKWSAGRR